MDYIVHGVAKSWTRLSNFHFHFFESLAGLERQKSMPRTCIRGGDQKLTFLTIS